MCRHCVLEAPAENSKSHAEGHMCLKRMAHNLALTMHGLPCALLGAKACLERQIQSSGHQICSPLLVK